MRSRWRSCSTALLPHCNPLRSLAWAFSANRCTRRSNFDRLSSGTAHVSDVRSLSFHVTQSSCHGSISGTDQGLFEDRSTGMTMNTSKPHHVREPIEKAQAQVCHSRLSRIMNDILIQKSVAWCHVHWWKLTEITCEDHTYTWQFLYVYKNTLFRWKHNVSLLGILC